MPIDRDDRGELFHPASSFAVPGFPKLSRYAWSQDYHNVLKRILKKLARGLDEIAKAKGIRDAEFRAVVDSAPVREKVWAQRAGLGWIGKNSLLITRPFGSWVFLGGLLTTLKIEPTPPQLPVNHCGKCTKCLKACPTGAIVDRGELNARSCLSYLTVEYEGQIPSQFRDSFIGWVFGCDTCQDVCPWNKFARPSRHGHFVPKPKLMVPDLHMWSQMSDEDFELLTAGTALRRAGRERLRRNALAVMGLL